MQPMDTTDHRTAAARAAGPVPAVFRTALVLGMGVTMAAGAVLVGWTDPTFPEGGVLAAGAAFVALGFVTASVSGSRAAWAGMVCGAVLPAVATAVGMAVLLPDPTGDYRIIGLALPAVAVAAAVTLGSLGFGLKTAVWPATGGFHAGRLLVAVGCIVLAVIAAGTVRGDLRWGGLFRTCPDGRSCVYEVGLSMVVPSGWHVQSPASSEILWEMAWDASPEHVGVMVKRGESELVNPSPRPATLDELEAAVVTQTSGASMLLMGNSPATAERMTLPIGEASCVRYERWMFLVDWTPEVRDCWFFVGDTIVLVSSVDAPAVDVDAFLRSMRRLPGDSG